MPLFKRENLGSVSDFLVVSCGVAELKIFRQPGNLDPPPYVLSVLSFGTLGAGPSTVGI